MSEEKHYFFTSYQADPGSYINNRVIFRNFVHEADDYLTMDALRNMCLKHTGLYSYKDLTVLSHSELTKAHYDKLSQSVTTNPNPI